MNDSRPLIDVISDRRELGGHHFHMVGEKYLAALVLAADAHPLALPTLGFDHDIEEVLGRLDGIFLTGSASNIEPHHYEGTPSRKDTWHDPERDDVALKLIPAVIEMGLPLFAVCRGFQEMNVALGGTLHQLVHEIPGYLVHKEDPSQPQEEQYGPAHRVEFVKGGLLHTITGQNSTMVNSLHSQAVNRLAPCLKKEALAEDGLIEAFTVSDAPGFTLGVQWHPEWQVMENPVSRGIFRAFGQSCRDFRQKTGKISGVF